MENNNKRSGGIGFCGLLTIAFIVLKLCGVIAWSWVWVFAPLWVSVAIVFVCVVVIVAIKALCNR